MTGEIRYRNALVSEALAPIKKTCLLDPNVSSACKLNVIRALVLSRGLHLASTWSSLDAAEEPRFHAMLMKAHRAVFPTIDGYIALTDAGTLRALQVPHPRVILALCRIALFARMNRVATMTNKALIIAASSPPRSWLRAVQADLELISQA